MDLQKIKIDLLKILRQNKLVQSDFCYRWTIDLNKVSQSNLTIDQFKKMAQHDSITNLADHILNNQSDSIKQIDSPEPNMLRFECNLFVCKPSDLKAIIEAVICKMNITDIIKIKEYNAVIQHEREDEVDK